MINRFAILIHNIFPISDFLLGTELILLYLFQPGQTILVKVEVMDVTTVQVSWNITTNLKFPIVWNRSDDLMETFRDEWDSSTSSIIYSPIGLSSYTVMPVNNPITR